MIHGNIKDTKRYESLHPLFAEAFAYIKANDFSTCETQVIELKGRDLFVIVSDTDLKQVEDAKLEAHNKYIDIQMPISMGETMGWAYRDSLQKPIDSFNEERDIQFYADTATSYASLQANDFAIFWPSDAHAPCIGEGKVRKVIVKIKCE